MMILMLNTMILVAVGIQVEISEEAVDLWVWS